MNQPSQDISLKEATEKISNDFEAYLRFLNFWKKFLKTRSKVEKEYAELFYSLASESAKACGVYQQYVDHFKKSENFMAEAYAQFFQTLSKANSEMIIPTKSGDQNIDDYNFVVCEMRTAKTEFENYIKTTVKDVKAKIKKGDDEKTEPDSIIRDAANDVLLQYEKYRQKIDAHSLSLKDKFISSTTTTHNMINGFIKSQRELFQKCLKVLDFIEGDLAKISGVEIWKTSHESNMKAFYNHDFDNQHAIMEFLKKALETETSGKSFKPAFMTKAKRKSNSMAKLPDNHQQSLNVQVPKLDQIPRNESLTGIPSNNRLQLESSEEYSGVRNDKNYESSDEEYQSSSYVKVGDNGKGIYEQIVDSYIEDMQTNTSLASKKSTSDANIHSMRSGMNWQNQSSTIAVNDQTKVGMENISGNENQPALISAIGEPKAVQKIDEQADEVETDIDPFAVPSRNEISINRNTTTNSKISFDLDDPFSIGSKCSSPDMQQMRRPRERPGSVVVHSGQLYSETSGQQVNSGNLEDLIGLTTRKTVPITKIETDDPFDVKSINNQDISQNTETVDPKTLRSSRMIVNERVEAVAQRRYSFNQTKGMPRYNQPQYRKNLFESCNFVFGESFIQNLASDPCSLFSPPSRQIGIVSNVGISGTPASGSLSNSNEKMRVAVPIEPEINDPFLSSSKPPNKTETSVVSNLSKETSMSDTFVDDINSKNESYPTQANSVSISTNIKPPPSTPFPRSNDQPQSNKNVEVTEIFDDPFAIPDKTSAINLLVATTTTNIASTTVKHGDMSVGNSLQDPLPQVFDDPFAVPTTATTTNSTLNVANQLIKNNNVTQRATLTTQQPQPTFTANENATQIQNPVHATHGDTVIVDSMKSVQKLDGYIARTSTTQITGNRVEASNIEIHLPTEQKNQPGLGQIGISLNILQDKPSNLNLTMSPKLNQSGTISAAKSTNVSSPKPIPPRKSIDQRSAASAIINVPHTPSPEKYLEYIGPTAKITQKRDLQLKITENLNYLHTINEMPIIEIKGVVFCRFEKDVLSKALQECISLNDCLIKFQTFKTSAGKVMIEPNPAVSYEMPTKEPLKTFAVSSKAAMAQIGENSETSIPVIRYINIPKSGSTGPLEFQLIVVDDRHTSGEIKISLSVKPNPLQSWISNVNTIASDSPVAAKDIQLIIDMGRYMKIPPNWNGNPFHILQHVHPLFLGCENCWDPKNHRFSLKMDNIIWDGSSSLQRRVFNFILRQPQGYKPQMIEKNDGPLNVFAKFNLTSCNMTDLGIQTLSDESQRFAISKVERSVCTGSYVSMF